MAGRPRKMAAGVREVEEMALALSVTIFEIMPDQYRKKMMTHGFADWQHAKLGDASSQAWYDSACSALVASQTIGRLGDLLRAKADIQGPGPHDAFSAEVDEFRDACGASNDAKTGLR